METKIPIIEIGHLLDTCGTRRKVTTEVLEAANNLKLAFEQYGVAYLRIDKYENDFARCAISKAISTTRQLFKLDESTKARFVNNDDRPGITRGFLPVGSESGSDLYELKEAFSYSYNWEIVDNEPTNALEARNVWPSNFTAGRKTLERYYKLCSDIMAAVARALVLTVDTIEADLERVVRSGETICLMRCIHYLSGSGDANETGSVPHTDWGFATLIGQTPDSEAALQVFIDDQYVNVAPVPGTFVINCGDYASVISGGRLRSPKHRVILTDTHRYSLVYFSYPAFSTPLPQNSNKTQLELSLYANQSRGPLSSRDGDGDGITFGEHVLYKWEQVQRDIPITTSK